MFSMLKNVRWLSVAFIFVISTAVLVASRAFAAPPSMYISDGNNRILKFVPPFTTGMSASAVLGQPDFSSSSSGVGPDALHGPGWIDHDAAGNLFVADSVNNRVLEFLQPITTGESASLVLGQPDFYSNASGTALNQMWGAGSIALDRRGDGSLYVAVTAHVRKFVPPFSNGMFAALQLGNNGSIPQTIAPSGISLNNEGDLFVSDSAHQRVLQYKAPIKGNQLAKTVLGASSLDHVGHGVFYSPTGSAVDSKGNLWVADLQYNRVLEFTPPFWNDKQAALVIGHPDLVPPSTTPGLSQSELSQPAAITFDGRGNLWVVDNGNHRVLEFVPPFSNGMNASVVIGQTDFVSNSYGASASQLFFPGGITFAP